jgi:putative nucleotidyltransferase with HDIG domain
MALSSDQIENIRLIGLMHDIGKMYLPPKCLVEASDLSTIERKLIMDHPVIGFEMLGDIGLPAIVRQSVLQHHEHIDGSGYPCKLEGYQILTEAKVVSVADVIDAMTSHRMYSTASEVDDAIEEISKNSGTFYDPTVVNACMRIFSLTA